MKYQKGDIVVIGTADSPAMCQIVGRKDDHSYYVKAAIVNLTGEGWARFGNHTDEKPGWEWEATIRRLAAEEEMNLYQIILCNRSD